MFSTKINAIFVVLWAVLRYLFVKIFWPFFRPSKTSQKFKFYYNGDIISSDDNAEAVVTRGHKIVFVGSHSKVKIAVAICFSDPKYDLNSSIQEFPKNSSRFPQLYIFMADRKGILKES